MGFFDKAPATKNLEKELVERQKREEARKALEIQRETNFLYAVRGAALKIIENKKLNTQEIGIWKQNIEETIKYYFSKNPADKNDISISLTNKDNIKSVEEKLVNLFASKLEMQRNSEFFVAAYYATEKIIRKEDILYGVRPTDAPDSQQIKKMIIDYLNNTKGIKDLLYQKNFGKMGYIENLAKDLEEIYTTRLVIKIPQRKRA